jgi:hypothetical protein
MDKEEKKEIIKGYFVGDTVYLKEETDYSKKNGFKLNSVGIVSKNDNEESLKGWVVIDYEKRIREAVDKMKPEEIKKIYSDIVAVFDKEIKNNKNGK